MKSLLSTILLILIVQAPTWHTALFANPLSNQGFNNGTNVENRAIENSTLSWANLTNVEIFNSFYVTAGPLSSKNQFSDYLEINGFGFSIPKNALITGIEIKLQHKLSNSENEIKDYLIQIVKNGNICTVNKALSSNWKAQDTTMIYGSSSDTWGETWSINDINASDFGAVVSVIRSGNSGVSATAMIDNIKIKVYYEDQILPITLIEFEAYSVGDHIQLHWSTGSEINADYVAIERSEDGNVFDIAGIVECAGNTNFITYYSYEDNSPPAGILYYRLKQFDIDGSYTYSNIVWVNYIAFTGDSHFIVYPCPSDGSEIRISLRSFEGQQLMICIKTLYGQNIFSDIVCPASKDHSEILLQPHLQLDAGTYIITVENTFRLFQQTLVIY